MRHYLFFRIIFLAVLFVKEQLKEPVALFWTVISPVVTYYLIQYSRGAIIGASVDYVSSTSWFYAYVSSSVAMFGLAFYIIGRRESGFLRSFVYKRQGKVIFLLGQFFAYSVVAILYCSVFYILTRSFSGSLSGSSEYLIVVVRFYICFLLFSIPSLLLTLIPLGFQNASTVFSVLSLAMLGFGVVGIGSPSPLLMVVNYFNPMWWANKIMLVGVLELWIVFLVVVVFLVISFLLMFRFLIIGPVWSRY